MLKRNFDPKLPYTTVRYLRMSDSKQNPRSPDQQEAEIERVQRNLGYPWQCLRVYRDDAKKGALIRRRPAFQQMLQDIKLGVIKPDLIQVDTSERIGRADELREIKRKLRTDYGVLLVAANNQFCDPTTPQGQALESFEQLRATEENRIKAHQVVRAKRDLVKRKLWPGGPQPFGFQLVPITKDSVGLHHTQNCVLEPLEEEAWIIRRLFQRADETHHGQPQLAKYLNGCDDIPDKYKPFHGHTVGYWLDQEIYYGDYYWPKNSTGIVNDIRRVEANPEEEITHVPEFCPPIVDRELWMRVQSVREERRRRLAAQRNKNQDNKLLQPLVPGLSVNYLLSGLARCGLCGSSMCPKSSGRTSKAGKKYVYYTCPRSIDGTCSNKQTIPEDWLRAVVVEKIKASLFSLD